MERIVGKAIQTLSLCKRYEFTAIFNVNFCNSKVPTSPKEFSTGSVNVMSRFKPS